MAACRVRVSKAIVGRCWRHYTTRPHPSIDRIVRVDHAGEFGADRIYAGQMAVLGNTASGTIVKKMWEQEKAHLQLFDKLVKERRVRPTALMPLWDVLAYGLGYGTAVLGKEAAMACTVAVEEVIGEHYNNQLRELLTSGLGDEELLQGISSCRDDELEHLDTALEHGAEDTPGYELLSSVVKFSSRTAIWLSERL